MYDKINLLDGLNKPRFKRREIYPPRPRLQPTPTTPSPKSKKLPWKLILPLVLIIVVISTAISLNVIFSSNSLLNNLTDLSPQNSETTFWGKVKKLVGAEEKLLEGEAENRINILLLGQGGAGHEGPYLTDTIILASIKPSTNQVAAISIPRDLYVPVYKNDWQRINYANSYGEVEMNGQGGEIASQTVSDVFNLPVHYFARVDFEGFKKVIDDLGGINVYVEKSFTDSQYPTADFGIEEISFEKGWQKMTGETALKFARSRHGNNGEAGDFARAKRQQKIIIAIKNEVFSFGSLFRPDKFIKAASDFSDHFSTNLKTWEILRLTKFAKTINLENIVTRVLDDSPTGPLAGALTEDGAFVLKTKTGDFTELASIAENIFLSPSEAQVLKSQKEAQEKKELLKNIKNEGYANIIIQNGTLTPGLAKRAGDYLASLEFNILGFSNAQTQGFEKTIIYDFTKGKKKYNLELLKQKVTNNIKKSNFSDFENLMPDTEFLVILGSNYVEPPVPPPTLSLPTVAGTTATSTKNLNPETATSTRNNLE